MSTDVEVPAERGGVAPVDPRPDELFEGFPFGVVIGDRDRTLRSLNSAASEMLAELESEAPLTCCEAFGCREPGTPLEHGCITELALSAAGEALPEIRADIGERAAWVTAKADRGGSVIFHLRPGDRGDRRRRTDPHWLSGPKLEVTTLGRMRLANAGSSVAGQWLEQRPGQLLKYLLANRDRVVPSEELAEAFWPEQPSSLNSVRHFIHVLRERLEPGRERRAPSSFIVARNGGYGLDRKRLRIDADEFERAARAGLAAAGAGESSAADHQLELACALYTGEFIADEPYADWVLPERERLHSVASRALQTLSTLRIAAADFDRAAVAARRLAELNPLDERAQHDVIMLLLREGRRTEAAKRYDALRIKLQQRFGDQPDFQLADAMSAARALRS